MDTVGIATKLVAGILTALLGFVGWLVKSEMGDITKMLSEINTTVHTLQTDAALQKQFTTFELRIIRSDISLIKSHISSEDKHGN